MDALYESQKFGLTIAIYIPIFYEYFINSYKYKKTIHWKGNKLEDN